MYGASSLPYPEIVKDTLYFFLEGKQHSYHQHFHLEGYWKGNGIQGVSEQHYVVCLLLSFSG